VDKLCQRFALTQNERHWRDCSFCLLQLSFSSERAIKIWMDHFLLYAPCLWEEKVKSNMLEICAKLKKNSKTDKNSLNGFEDKLKEAAEVALSNYEASQKAKEARGVILIKKENKVLECTE
jgi:condensin complex subunit 1